MPKKRPAKSSRRVKGRSRSSPSPRAQEPPGPPRIIGGRYRAKRLAYSGDPRTRPMKDRVREATFNLIGPVDKSTLAIDLFAGTGALALEALSRGASHAILIERHFPTTKLIRQNCENLGVQDVCTIHSSDAFHWTKHQLEEASLDQPWLVFISPPYAFYQDRRDDMLQMIAAFQGRAPRGSTLVAEFDQAFDSELLPTPAAWDARSYPPAIVAIWRNREGDQATG